jgi:asparagine synthase (glutamine-hydrolysing)
LGWKVRKGGGKYILIKALGDRLPAALLERPKMGFGVPLGTWFRTSLRDFLLDHLTDARISERGIVNGSFLKAVIEEHMSGRRNNQHWLWTLLMLELWLREFENTAQGSQEQSISYAVSS